MILFGEDIVQRVLIRVVPYLIIEIYELFNRQSRLLFGVLGSISRVSELDGAFYFIEQEVETRAAK